MHMKLNIARKIAGPTRLRSRALWYSRPVLYRLQGLQLSDRALVWNTRVLGIEARRGQIFFHCVQFNIHSKYLQLLNHLYLDGSCRLKYHKLYILFVSLLVETLASLS